MMQLKLNTDRKILKEHNENNSNNTSKIKNQGD